MEDEYHVVESGTIFGTRENAKFNSQTHSDAVHSAMAMAGEGQVHQLTPKVGMVLGDTASLGPAGV